MTLMDIKQHMMKVKMASLGGLSAALKVEPEMLRCMLAHWVSKGKIRKCMKKPACGSKCFQCPTTTTELYEWVDEDTRLAIL